MRRLPLIFLVLMILLQFSLGSTPIVGGIQFGINHTGFDKSSLPGLQFENTLNASHGVFIEVPLSSLLALRTSFLIANKGVFVKPNTQSVMKQRIYLSYFEVPLLIKLILPIQLDGLKPFLIGGPSFGFSVRNIFSHVQNGEEILYSRSQWNNNDGGVNLGIGFEGKHVSVFLQSYIGVNKITLDMDEFPVKNRSLSLVLSYSFQSR